jgi:hypothetical protein
MCGGLAMAPAGLRAWPAVKLLSGSETPGALSQQKRGVHGARQASGSNPARATRHHVDSR